MPAYPQGTQVTFTATVHKMLQENTVLVQSTFPLWSLLQACLFYCYYYLLFISFKAVFLDDSNGVSFYGFLGWRQAACHFTTNNEPYRLQNRSIEDV